MNFKLHNKYEITLNNKTYTAYNTLFKTVYEKIANLEQYTSHIAIGTGTSSKDFTDTKLSSYLMSFSTQTEEIQCDVSKSPLYIQKVVTIDSSNAQTFSFSEIGITNTSEFDPIIFNHVLLTDTDGNVVSITRNSGDTLQIKVTIYLELTPQSSALFTKGKNQLIKQMLGENLDIEDNSLYIARGENLAENVLLNRATPILNNAVKCSNKITYNDDQSVTINFSADLGVGETEEVLIVYNNQACIRLNTQEFNTPQVQTVEQITPSAGNTIELGLLVKNVESCYKISDTNILESDYFTAKYSNKITDKVSNIFDLPFTASTPRFVSKDGKMIAFIYNDYTYIYKYDNHEFVKLNTTQVPSANLQKIIMMEDIVICILTEEPYIQVYKVVENNVIRQTMKLTTYSASAYPYSFVDVDATIIDNKITLGLILNDQKYTPLIMTLETDSDNQYCDKLAIPSLDSAKVVCGIYNPNYNQYLISFMCDTYQGITDYYVEDYTVNGFSINSNAGMAYGLLANSLGVLYGGRMIISQKDTSPKLKAYYYPNMESASNDFSSADLHFISYNGDYIISKTQEDSSYKIFNSHIIDALSEFESGFPDYIEQDKILDLTFAGDYLIVFYDDSLEPNFGLLLKNNLTRIDNLSDQTANYLINYNKFVLLGQEEDEGVKANLTFTLGDQ